LRTVKTAVLQSRDQEAVGVPLRVGRRIRNGIGRGISVDSRSIKDGLDAGPQAFLSLFASDLPAKRGGVPLDKAPNMSLAPDEEEREAVPDFVRTGLQSKKDERGHDPAAFIPRVADSARHPGDELDQPGILPPAGPEKRLYNGRRAVSSFREKG
jgi:hypothetical protein